MFHITVGLAPTRGVDLQRELKIIKAALLYADKVNICSPKIWMENDLYISNKLTPFEKIDFLISTAGRIQPDSMEIFLKYKELKKIKHRTSMQIQICQKIEQGLEQIWNQVRSEALEKEEYKNMCELEKAVKIGLVEITKFKSVKKENDDIINQYLNNITEAVTHGHTFPMFDDDTSDLFSYALKEGVVNVSDIATKRSRSIGLAAYLLEKLPVFETATIQEILDIRKELEKPIVHFRAGMINFSEAISSAPWDNDFSAEAEIILHQKVRPAVLEIEESVRTNSFMREFARNILDKPLGIPAGTGIALLISNSSSLPDILTQSLGIGIPTATVAYDAYKNWKEEKTHIEQNQVYLYYKANKLG